MELQNELFKLQDKKYAEFHSKLIPNIDKENIIGVRVPDVRKLAKKCASCPESIEFINNLPHKYYDENVLHGLLISEIKDYEECVKEVERFLPFVDNWAVCDFMSPRVFKKNKEKLIEKVKLWIKSSDTYTCRFGIGMLMKYYLDDGYKKEYLILPSLVKSDEYYINMMISWFYATALAKRWDDTICYLENKVFDKWIHNKIIQKACESYRITIEQKTYLKSIKMI